MPSSIIRVAPRGEVVNLAGAHHLRSIIDWAGGRDTLDGLTPAEIRGLPKPMVQAYRDGMLARGVDMMAYTSGLTSAAHTPELVDEALAAFSATLADMMQNGVLPCLND